MCVCRGRPWKAAEPQCGATTYSRYLSRTSCLYQPLLPSKCPRSFSRTCDVGIEQLRNRSLAVPHALCEVLWGTYERCGARLNFEYRLVHLSIYLTCRSFTFLNSSFSRLGLNLRQRTFSYSSLECGLGRSRVTLVRRGSGVFTIRLLLARHSDFSSFFTWKPSRD